MLALSSDRCWPHFSSTRFHVGIRSIFYLAAIPGLLAFLMVVLVREQRAAVAAQSKIDIRLRQFPKSYWKYLLATALFGLGNSSNSFLILRTQDIGASLEQTILIYAAFNLVAALISYPAGSLSDRSGRRNVLLASFVIFPNRLSRLRANAKRRADRGAHRCTARFSLWSAVSVRGERLADGAEYALVQANRTAGMWLSQPKRAPQAPSRGCRMRLPTKISIRSVACGKSKPTSLGPRVRPVLRQQQPVDDRSCWLGDDETARMPRAA